MDGWRIEERKCNERRTEVKEGKEGTTGRKDEGK